MNYTQDLVDVLNISNTLETYITRTDCKELCQNSQLAFYNSQLLIIPSIIAINSLLSYVLLRHNEALKIKDETAIKCLNYMLSFNILLCIGFIIQFIFFIPK